MSILIPLFILVLNKMSPANGQGGTIGNFNITGIDILAVLNQLNIDDICETIKINQKDSICLKQLSIVCDNKNALYQMLDANSKFPYTGILVRTNLDVGSYDECINIDLTKNDVRVLGRHCTGGLVLPNTLLNTEINSPEYYALSTCMPNLCTPNDFITILSLPKEYAPLLNEFACSTKEGLPMQWQDYTVLASLLLICLIITLATLCDIYLNKSNGFKVFITAFSLAHNIKQLLKTSSGTSDQIKVLHGLRVISIAWIIVGHSFASLGMVPGINKSFLTQFEWSRTSTHVTSLHLAVDTFFFMSGLLLAHQYLKQKPASLLVHLKRIPLMYFQRYIRLTPVVASAFILLVTIFVHIGNGPIFYIGIQDEKDRCLRHWLAFFTYTQNYVAHADMCMIHTWYLSADWQLFVISPVILIPAAVLIKKHFNLVMGLLLIMNLVVGTVLPMLLKMRYDSNGNIYETHTRLNVYFMGFMLGIYMREKQESKWRLSKTTNIVSWMVALAILAATIMTYKEVQLASYFENDYRYDMYFILLRLFWSIGLTWVILACNYGHGGFINSMLTTSTMQILSKLTFCMYMVHGAPTLYNRLTARAPIEYSQFTGFKDAAFAYITSICLAKVWTLVFESPLIILIKQFMRPDLSKHVSD